MEAQDQCGSGDSYFMHRLTIAVCTLTIMRVSIDLGNEKRTRVRTTVNWEPKIIISLYIYDA